VLPSVRAGASTLGETPAACETDHVTRSHSVLVVDDQAPFRLAAKAVLRRLDEFELAGEAASGDEAVELADQLHPELVLMDINMPRMSGIEATRKILAAHPSTVVILCSTYDVRDLPAEAGSSGAAGYVNKERLAGDLLRRVWAHRDEGWPGPG
jgi:DNA-binding NarL/FixJ family response regulator